MKSKIFMGLGAFALAVGGFFVTKANKRFTTPTHVFVNGLNVTLANISSTSHLTTIKGTGAKTCFFATISGTLHTMYTASTKATQVYYKP